MSMIADRTADYKQIRVTDVHRFLLGRGWRPAPSERADTAVFADGTDDDGKQIVLMFPNSERFSEYDRCVADLVRAISVIENRDEQAVLDDIAALADANDAGASPQDRRPEERAGSPRVIRT